MNNQYLDIITQKIPEDVLLNYFKRYGAKEHSRTERHIWFNTFCHGGDSPNKLCYNRDTKTFYCYTHCGFINMFSLLMKVSDMPFGRAVDTLAQLAGIDRRHLIAPERWVERAWDQQLESYVESRRLKVNTAPFEFPVIQDGVLKYFDHTVFYAGWLNEGITFDSMRRFEICWDEPQLAVIIPHRDAQGNLIGIRKRAVSAQTAKYLPVYLQDRQYAHPLGMNLYGLHLNKDAIQRSHSAVIFEGEKSVLKHYAMYGDQSNAVACCGSFISDAQRQLLMDLDVQEVTLAFDKDYDYHTEEGKRYKRKLEMVAQMLTPFVQTYVLMDYEGRLGINDAPIDQGKEVYECIVRKRCLVGTNGFRKAKIQRRF